MLMMLQEGERVARRGYWGDMVVSPYITFGIECQESSFFKKTNNMLTKVHHVVSKLLFMSSDSFMVTSFL